MFGFESWNEEIRRSPEADQFSYPYLNSLEKWMASLQMFELEKHICSSFTCEWHPLNSKRASSTDDDIISMAFKNMHKKQTHDSDGL